MASTQTMIRSICASCSVWGGRGRVERRCTKASNHCLRSLEFKLRLTHKRMRYKMLREALMQPSTIAQNYEPDPRQAVMQISAQGALRSIPLFRRRGRSLEGDDRRLAHPSEAISATNLHSPETDHPRELPPGRRKDPTIGAHQVNMHRSRREAG